MQLYRFQFPDSENSFLRDLINTLDSQREIDDIETAICDCLEWSSKHPPASLICPDEFKDKTGRAAIKNFVVETNVGHWFTPMTVEVLYDLGARMYSVQVSEEDCITDISGQALYLGKTPLSYRELSRQQALSLSSNKIDPGQVLVELYNLEPGNYLISDWVKDLPPNISLAQALADCKTYYLTH